ncbi:unnamed protein product [Urochloa decumbens]|uniref:NB-ARC domain-containing protein n=1 Tax=Urochloa decumbens TaxID=240449 RepID=A0ABC9BLA6_9POAL
MEKMASSAELKVLSIVGCGGLGKTILADQVYQSVKSQFSCAAFVTVSRNPDVKKIFRDIAKEVGIHENLSDHDLKQLIDELRKHLQEKRYLIVIDDIWDAKLWDTIKLALTNKNCESRVIATTRITAVASCLSSQGGNVYEMGSLSFEDSKRVLNNIGSALAKNPDAENMTAILSMSYFDIPPYLRTCLLYLSVFPEDYEIKKQHLINRWTAEGFIQEEEGRTKYEIGDDYFNDLINRSMIQPVDVKFGQAKACRVHDIILDYIKCKAAEENFVTSLDAAEHAYTSEYKVRRLCVSNHTEENVAIWANPNLSQVRPVTIFGQPVKTSLLPSPALRVLDLGYCRRMEEHHLASIEKLFHLKYFCLCSGFITKLPEKIGELQYLQTLDVRDGIIGQMHSLEELREYGVRSYEQGKSLQEFSKLTKLRTLKIEWNFDSLLEGSEELRQVEGCHRYVGALLSSCNLYNLYITDSSEDNNYPLSLDSWHPVASCSLRKLCIKECLIYKVPNWMGSLGNLVVLKLNAILCLRPEDVEILAAIPSLLFLELLTAGGTNGRITVHGRNGFRSLKYFSLLFYCCGTALDFQEGSMQNLEHVKLMFHVHKRECLNGASSLGIQHLSALSKVEIKISGNCVDDKNYEPTDRFSQATVPCVWNGGAANWVASAINSAVMSHPNRPTVRFETTSAEVCEHFEYAMREGNRLLGGLLTEWFKIWQIEEEQTQQEQTHGLTDEEEQTGGEEGEEEADIIEEEDTYEEEGEEQSAEEKEQQQREGNGSSN